MDPITIQTTVDAPVAKVWKHWNQPEHITKWAFASNDWEAPFAENNLNIGKKFKVRMAAKDKSSKFDFTGTYKTIQENKLIEFEMDDGRNVKIDFISLPTGTKIIQTFDPESENSIEMQKEGWQSILNNFKKYVEGK